MPTPYTMKFIIIVWLAFLARQRPVSTMANPACMNMTKKPVTRVQTKLIATLFWPAWFTKSPMVSPFLLSPTVTSLALPVSEPSGSPLACASAVGTGTFATSASVMAFGAGVAGAAAAGAAAGAWAKPTGARQSAASRNVSNLFVVVFILASSLLPDCVLHISLVKHADDSEQTDG